MQVLRQHNSLLARRQHAVANQLNGLAYTPMGGLPVRKTTPVLHATSNQSGNTVSTSTVVTPPPKPPAPAPIEDNPLSLASPTGGALAFHMLWGSSTVLSLAANVVPDQMLASLLPATTASGLTTVVAFDDVLLRMAGVFLIVSAATEFALQDAAANSRLRSATYQRLMLGILAKNMLFLTAFALAQDLWSPGLTVLYPGAALLSTFLTASVFKASNTRNGVFSWPSGVGVDLFPNTAAGGVYGVFALVYLGTLGACYLPPEANPMYLTTLSPASSLLIHTWAPNFLLASVACLVLKDAADRGRLGSSTFKSLNLGLALMEAAYSLLFLYERAAGNVAGGAVGLGNLSASMAIAAYCLYQWKTAKK